MCKCDILNRRYTFIQTFLPYSDFKKSAECLDNKRLCKQRLEALQILNTLTGKSNGWKNHPAVKMWKSYEGALSYYGWVMCVEWINRGFNSTIHEKFCPFLYGEMPPWLNEEFCKSHRANLTRKYPEWYSKFWQEDPTLPYVWPVR
jgi:hypothetical protein